MYVCPQRIKGSLGILFFTMKHHGPSLQGRQDSIFFQSSSWIKYGVLPEELDIGINSPDTSMFKWTASTWKSNESSKLK